MEFLAVDWHSFSSGIRVHFNAIAYYELPISVNGGQCEVEMRGM